MPSAVAFIPARVGSKRVPGKNVRVLGGHPMIAYTIGPALESKVFDAVIVSTDSEEIAAIARHYGAEVPFLRPAAMASDTSPDIEWLEHTIGELSATGRNWDCFSLLRPTSPFRTADTIRRAWTTFTSQEGVDSLRAVELCTQHPGKMWIVRGQRMYPLLPFGLVSKPVPPKPPVAKAETSRGTARRTRRYLGYTCKTPRWRWPGLVWSATGGRLPVMCWCRFSPKATKGSTSTTPSTGWWLSGC